MGKASFLSQARSLRRYSDSRFSVARGLDRDTRMTALLDRAMETAFFRDRLDQAGVAFGSHTQGELTRNAFGLDCFSKLTPVGKQEIRSRFPEGVLTRDTQDGRTYRSTTVS